MINNYNYEVPFTLFGLPYGSFDKLFPSFRRRETVNRDDLAILSLKHTWIPDFPVAGTLS